MTSEWILGPVTVEFSKLLEQVTAHPYNETHLFLQQAHLAADSLPISIRSKLLEFYLRGNEEGVLLFKSCPQDPNINEILTPLAYFEKPSFVSEICLALVAAKLGQMFAFAEIDKGALFHNVTPKFESKNKQSSASSIVNLRLHTEQHFHHHSPDYVLLYCLRTAVDAETHYVNVPELLKHLDEKNRSLLFEPLFRTGLDYVFGNNDEQPGNGPVRPILFGNRDAPFVRYDRKLTIGVNSDAQKALNKVHSIFDENYKSIVLSAGDLLVLDNRRVVHGRSPFKAKHDGTDRWLQRVKVLRDIDRAADKLIFSKRQVITKKFDLGDEAPQ